MQRRRISNASCRLRRIGDHGQHAANGRDHFRAIGRAHSQHERAGIERQSHVVLRDTLGSKHDRNVLPVLEGPEASAPREILLSRPRIQARNDDRRLVEPERRVSRLRIPDFHNVEPGGPEIVRCLLYTTDAADD